ncbi:MAG: hypothetical protein AB1331_00700 [Bacillota bacterium]
MIRNSQYRYFYLLLVVVFLVAAVWPGSTQIQPQPDVSAAYSMVDSVVRYAIIYVGFNY